VVDRARPVALYGAGQLGLLALAFCRHVGVTVQYVLDQNAVPGQLLGGEVPVFPPTCLHYDLHSSLLVAVATSAYSPIVRGLQERGWTNILPFYDYAQYFGSEHPLNNGWFSGPLSPEDQAAIRTVFLRLADTHSRTSYLQFLAWRILREEWSFPETPVRTDDRYFIGPVRAAITDAEDIVDIGAYDGRFLFRLLELTQGRSSSTLLFEPDIYNAALLSQALARLSAIQRASVEQRSEAVSDVEGIAGFNQGFDMASRLSANGSSTVATLRIDDLGLHPTYVKIHVEGGELRVLRGAVNTLRRTRPIVAVTVYHNRDGLWETPLFLIERLERYDFLFRLHSWCGTGAVLYAIPHERRVS